jgi:hypothetical protein
MNAGLRNSRPATPRKQRGERNQSSESDLIRARLYCAVSIGLSGSQLIAGKQTPVGAPFEGGIGTITEHANHSAFYVLGI